MVRIKSIFLHIGDAKTGTSYIQNFLDVNRQSLYKNHHILYPNMVSKDYVTGRYHNHALWINELKDNPQTFIKELADITRFTKDRSTQGVLLSNEGWLFNNQSIELCKYLVSEKWFTNIKIICYLRRIDHWLESAWKQWGLKEHKDFDEYYQQPRFHKRFKIILTKLAKWEKFVGRENIILRPYEKIQLPNGIIDDFLQCLGIDYQKHQWNRTEDNNLATNLGFNQDVLDILHHCRPLYSDIHDNRFFQLFSDSLGDKFQKEPFESYGFLSPAQRVEIIENNRPFEQEIAQRYMGRKSEGIFLEPLPDQSTSWQPYEGISLEAALPVLVKLIYENNQKISGLKQQITYLEKWKMGNNIIHKIKKKLHALFS